MVYAPIVIEATDRQTNRLIGSETIWINVVEENILPDSVYNIQGNELIGFSQEFINRQDYYSQFNTIKLPERVFTIKDEAFDGKLPNFIKKIIFDEHLQHVGNKAFQNNTFINTVESTGSKFDFSYDVGATFQGCTSLTLVDFSNSEIDNGFPTDCFNGCEALLEVKCAYFMSIGSSCFNGCKSLTTITNCFAVESIFDHAFSGCTNLQTIDFSQSSLDTIGDNAFEHCSSLVTIAFPDCFYSLGKRAFTNCSSLINVDFSRCTKTLNSIGDHAFENCFSLVSIVFPVNNNLVYGLADNVGSGKVVVKKDSTTGKYT
ncbi:MAG: leucine-rich repeat domain-containing protein [Mycoplasmoidaceae bacterium]|nr:leucine-rich repeat domain-containing protein [Mycoplasmoidaceae bacterium]